MGSAPVPSFGVGALSYSSLTRFRDASHGIVRHDRNKRASFRGGGKFLTRSIALMTALLGMIACLTIPANSAIAADDGLKTYQLTGAGWVETDDKEVTWADTSMPTEFAYCNTENVNHCISANRKMNSLGNGVIQSIWVTAETRDNWNGAGPIRSASAFALDPNGYVTRTSSETATLSTSDLTRSDVKTQQDTSGKVISLTSWFVTQIGSKTTKTKNDTSNSTSAYLIVKARSRTAAESGTQAAVQLPQSGDPAASVWQSAPYLIALAAIGGAVVVSRRAKTSAV